MEKDEKGRHKRKVTVKLESLKEIKNMNANEFSDEKMFLDPQRRLKSKKMLI